MEICYYTNEGVKGFGNEDSLLLDTFLINEISMQKVKSFTCNKSSALFAISDGVHVGKNAKIASLKTLEFLQKFAQNTPYFKINHTFSYIKTSLENYAIKYPRYKDASATLVACYLKENKATIFNVGDSRAYLFRSNKLSQLSYDYTQANQMLKNGEITQEEFANRSNFYDTLTGYLSIGENIDTPLHVKSLQMQKDDIMLLCSDG